MEDWNSKMEFEETELRLCLPGGGGGRPGDGGEVEEENNNKETNANGKRSCPHTSMVDLKLKLASNEATTTNVNIPKQKELLFASNQPAVLKLSPAKAQVVGWPPVQSFRKNKLAVAVEKSSLEGSDKVSAALVKVSMEGAPYLRKVDLKMYKNYRELSDALANKFHSFAAAGQCESQGMMNFINESKLNNLSNSSDYVPTYEDKDGDWMVVGDVPWEMFVASCKRLRIMKGAEAIGLAPRALQAECKNSQKKLNM